MRPRRTGSTLDRAGLVAPTSGEEEWPGGLPNIHRMLTRTWTRAILASLVMMLLASLPGTADVPLGSSVTLSGEASATWSTDPAGRIGAAVPP